MWTKRMKDKFQPNTMTATANTTFFAPELHIPNGTFNLDFYNAFGATEHFCFRNADGSIHVAELEINGAIFHVHETMRDALEPIGAKGVTCIIGLFVPNVDEGMQRAIQAGATEITPATDHDYGYRQGMFKDPFGHYWQIQKKIQVDGQL
jgi:PhnB protein